MHTSLHRWHYERHRPWHPDPGSLKLAVGTWDITSLAGKEPKFVCEVERYRLDIVRLNSTHTTGSGANLLQGGWTLFHGERHHARVSSLRVPQLEACMLGFSPVDQRVASLQRECAFTIIWAYAPNICSDYPAFFYPALFFFD